ncbi:MAG TPA: hypothetical protein PLO59_11110, partial [Bacteroidia bacterium]|nr:hypothetical protein [Bacteroidia bacterium]
EYRYASIDSSVLSLNENYFLPHQTYSQYIALNYKFVQDKRDYRLYALKGSYFDFELGKVGLGLLPNEPNLFFVTSTYKNTLKLAHRWHYSYSIKGRVAGPQQAPYYNQRALGYFNDIVRTYELYVINGQHYALFKSNLKFTLLPQQIVQLPVITDPKFGLIPFAFYLNLFADLGYVYDDVFASTNPLANVLLPGVGIGLDLVTYYNAVIRLEYGINRRGETGLFLNFTNALY